MRARCDSRFDVFDDDGDGQLTAEEFAAVPHARGDARTLFEARDLDGDGRVTRGEFCSGAR
jgi:Ca2+-binding EF-hand superfamily protein